MNKTDKILITGGTGLVGRYIARDLAEHGYQNICLVSRSGNVPPILNNSYPHITSIQADVRDVYPLHDHIDEHTIVIHTAATISYDPKIKESMMDINVGGTANIVNLCLDRGAKKMIHLSSIAAVGRGKEKTISEKTEWEESKYNSGYAVSKYRSELEVWRGQEEGLDVLVLNPGIILGSGVWGTGSLAIYDQMNKGMSFYPNGGTGVVDVRDIARFVSTALSEDLHGQRYILVGTNLSYQKLFSDISVALGKKPPRISITPTLESIAVLGERLKSLLLRKSPVITRQSLMSARHHSVYDTEKSTAISGFAYTDYERTIAESCAAYLKKSEDLLPMGSHSRS